MAFTLTKCLSLLALLGLQGAVAQPEIDFRRPSEPLADLIERPWPGLYNPDPTRKKLLKLDIVPLVPEEILQREEISLAGFRMYEETRAKSRRLYAERLAIIDLSTGKEDLVVGLPDPAIILQVQWSPDGKHIAALLERSSQVELWITEVSTSQARKVSDLAVHAGMDDSLAWSSNSRSVWVKTVSDDGGPPPSMTGVQTRALVRETSGSAVPAQTHQGTLRTSLDIERFEYYFSTVLTRISLDGSHRFLGDRGLYGYFRESPDQRYLLVERLVEPWSFWVNADQFAYDVEVWDSNTGEISKIASSPTAEALPYGGGSVRTGARGFSWRSDKPATVVWIEALDGGNPYVAARVRDRVLSLDAPFSAEPFELIATRDRIGDILWDRDERAVILSWDWVERDLSLSAFNPNINQKYPKTLVTFEMGDRYRHPGLPLMAINQHGFPIIHTDESGEHMFMIGDGGSLEGDRPFIDRFNFDNRRKKRLFRSSKPYFESPITILDDQGEELLIRRESPTMPPNFFLWSRKEKFHTQVTSEVNPYPELENVQKVLLKYKRKDGISLTANLYLPAGYNARKDGPLPTLLWAYPKAYQSAQNASQLKKSPYQFLNGRWNRPIIWVTQGYAVLDDPAMPIVVRGGGNANDSFIPQLVESAEAAVKELVKRGVSDRDKIMIGGHSYGAFMTANLLAHTDLFSAGIARGGAYNRTLTPFGFQSEERNLWQAPRVYLEMSPFLNASRIDEPLLLLHGEKDENPGTYPLQSERLFHAINGLGLQARLVMLPHEAHTFRGEGGVMHSIWEMERWMDLHLKGERAAVMPITSSRAGSGSSASSVSAEGGEP